MLVRVADNPTNIIKIADSPVTPRDRDSEDWPGRGMAHSGFACTDLLAMSFVFKGQVILGSCPKPQNISINIFKFHFICPRVILGFL